MSENKPENCPAGVDGSKDDEACQRQGDYCEDHIFSSFLFLSVLNVRFQIGYFDLRIMELDCHQGDFMV